MLIQRVLRAAVLIEDEVYGEIKNGFLVFFAVKEGDNPKQTAWMANKLTSLRAFSDAEGKMNLSLKETGGEALIVSQFTLYGNCLKGRRPSFIQSALPEVAEPIYDKFVNEVKADLGTVQTGKFGAEMRVEITNNGPVTFLIDAPNYIRSC
jgi:D-tyrosyl-tRNA(Tyr) deacylase